MSVSKESVEFHEDIDKGFEEFQKQHYFGDPDNHISFVAGVIWMTRKLCVCGDKKSPDCPACKMFFGLQ